MIAVANSVLIYGTYVVCLGGLGLYSLWVVRRGRELADEVDDADKYWT